MTMFQNLFKKFLALLIATSFVANAHADNKQYWWQMYDSNTNSSVSLTNDQGNAVAATLNPTGVNAMAAATAATQPSVTTRIRLTTAVEGGACSLPRDDVAITADRSLLLVCQSTLNEGVVWKRPYAPTITVVVGPSAFGNFAAGQSHYSFVECPAGFNITGGGAQLVNYSPYLPNAASNAPDSSAPFYNPTEGKYTGWSVAPGGASGYSEFRPFAVCGK
jgi:hypothetical protein